MEEEEPVLLHGVWEQGGERGTLLWPCVGGLAVFPLGVQWAGLVSTSFLSAAVTLFWPSGQRRQAFLGAGFLSSSVHLGCGFHSVWGF